MDQPPPHNNNSNNSLPSIPPQQSSQNYHGHSQDTQKLNTSPIMLTPSSSSNLNQPLAVSTSIGSSSATSTVQHTNLPVSVPTNTKGSSVATPNSTSGSASTNNPTNKGKEPEKKKKRLTQACDHCRKKKIRCDGIRPSCKNCHRLSIPCTYVPSSRKRGRNGQKMVDRPYGGMAYAQPYGRPGVPSNLHQNQRPSSMQQRPSIASAFNTHMPSLHLKVDPRFGQDNDEPHMDPEKAAAAMQSFTGNYYLPVNNFQFLNNAQGRPGLNNGGNNATPNNIPPNSAATIHSSQLPVGNASGGSSTSVDHGSNSNANNHQFRPGVFGLQHFPQNVSQQDHAKAIAQSITNLFSNNSNNNNNNNNNPNVASSNPNSLPTLPMFQMQNFPMAPFSNQPPNFNPPFPPAPLGASGIPGKETAAAGASTTPLSASFSRDSTLNEAAGYSQHKVANSESNSGSATTPFSNSESNLNPQNNINRPNPTQHMQQLRSQFEQILDAMWPHTRANKSLGRAGDANALNTPASQNGGEANTSSLHGSSAACEDNSTLQALELPNNTVTDQLVTAFFEFNHPVFPVVHKRAFVRQYRQNSANPLLVNAMCASSVMFTNRIDDERKQLYGKYSKLVQDSYHESTFAPSLEVVQASLIMALCESRMGNYPKSWVYTSMSFRLAMEQGYHRADEDGDREINTDASVAVLHETQRRVFWISYLLDRYTCIMNGHPMGINDSDIKLRLPMPDEPWDNGVANSACSEMFCPPFSNGTSSQMRPSLSLGKPGGDAGILSHYIKLVSILSHITHHAIAPTEPTHPGQGDANASATSATPNPKFSVFDNALREWKEGLPASLDYSECKSQSHPPHHTVFLSCLHVVYYSSIIHLNRQNMRYLNGGVGQYDTSTGLALRSIERCRVAAMEIVSLSRHLDTFPLAFSHPLLPWAFFQAGTILIHYMVAGNTAQQQEAAKNSITTLSYALRDGLGRFWNIAQKYHVVLSGMVNAWESAVGSSSLHDDASEVSSQANSSSRSATYPPLSSPPAPHQLSSHMDSGVSGNRSHPHQMDGNSHTSMAVDGSNTTAAAAGFSMASAPPSVPLSAPGINDSGFNPLAALFSQLSRDPQLANATSSGNFYTMQSMSLDMNALLSPTGLKPGVQNPSSLLVSSKPNDASGCVSSANFSHAQMAADNMPNHSGEGGASVSSTTSDAGHTSIPQSMVCPPFDFNNMATNGAQSGPGIDPIFLSQMGSIINELQFFSSSQAGLGSSLQSAAPSSPNNLKPRLQVSQSMSGTASSTDMPLNPHNHESTQ
ncbi:hypothetical protein H4219_002090 [Mycoemilia scoparia]|uniref:Zn(2)-C6 fungal-type domain-containing protein n=1 Tax=Mycoemilia scoparia TaxID=417184 RepID=A0A9W7ZYL5_9FUNG|nr:hypothetical protein H4219_002090 [Mycoemilia scoparia]